MYYGLIDSPVGTLMLAGDGEALFRVAFESEERSGRPDAGWQRRDSVFRRAADQLDAYFSGSLTGFELDLRPAGTEFQLRVYKALQSIPYGETTTYGAVARMIGRPRAVRAVGAANGRNPIPIIIPCHRVIGADGSLTGFGGGLEIKRYLLDLESGQRTLI